MDIEQLMDRLSRSGVTVILKVDDERVAEGGEPWTVVMSGQGVGSKDSFVQNPRVSLIASSRHFPGSVHVRAIGGWLVEI